MIRFWVWGRSHRGLSGEHPWRRRLHSSCDTVTNSRTWIPRFARLEVINDRSPAEGGTFFCNLAGRGVSAKQYGQSRWNLPTWQHTRLFRKLETQLCISGGTTFEHRLQNSCPERHTPTNGKHRCSHKKTTNVSFITFQFTFPYIIRIWYSVVKLCEFHATPFTIPLLSERQ